MKNCPHCNTSNAETNRFCQQCGRPLESDAPTIAGKGFDADATLQWTGKTMAAKGPTSRAYPVDVLFATTKKLRIGRSPDCEICLPHPTISRYHALLERLPSGLRLRDLESVNGVLVGGHRITEPVMVQERERIGIGPFLFSLVDGVVYSLDSSQSLRLEARKLEKIVSLGNGQTRLLLDNINLAVEPGEFISLLGPSGSGKSTLMDCLNGRRPATGGQVLANGEDFYYHFDSFRQSLGYVPQRDIVHAQLTVYRALYYTAKLRLPQDTEPAELEARIEEVIRLMELGPHRATLIANLSGGQIKRVSLGAELLARPCLLYIDEATSGLDAGTEARMMRLFRQLADEGKSVICITHNVDNVDCCNLILLLSRGKLIYFGPPQEAPGYFGVSRISEIYDRLGDKQPEDWEKLFATSELYREFVQKRVGLAPDDEEQKGQEEKRSRENPFAILRRRVDEKTSVKPEEGKTAGPDRPYRPPLWHQFRILTTRYAELMWGDPRSLKLLFLQAPIVALIILLGFMNKSYQDTVLIPRNIDDAERKALDALDAIISSWHTDRELTAEERGLLEKIELPIRGGKGKVNASEILQGYRKFQQAQVLKKLLETTGPVVPYKDIINPRYTYMLLFMISVTIMWFGCNNSAKEIVKEEAVYGRERAVNLGILPYLGSKFLLLSFITAVQTFFMMLIVYGGLGLLHSWRGDSMPAADYRLDYVGQYLVLVLLSTTGVALGLLLSACVSTPDRANTLLPYVLIPQIILGGAIMQITTGPLAWLAYTASPVYWAFRAIHLGANSLPTYMPGYAAYEDDLLLPCLALGIQTAVLLLLTAWFLRQKDVRKNA